MRVFRFFIPALLVLSMLAAPSPSNAQISVGISAGIAPPPLPVYEQPPIPGPDYLWTPGYWAWGPGGYYWVPGTWVFPPTVGFLWTPPWWGWSNGVYVFNAGYWGSEIGFYGGINYGFGYSGRGYDGGRWDHGHFSYNREANNFGDRHIANVYSSPVNRAAENRVSFNGGTGGIAAQPTAQEQAAMHGQHVQATAAQLQHVNAARSNPSLLAKTNNGQPKITATSQAGRFNSTGAVTTTSTTPHVQSNVRTTNTGPTGQKGGGNTGPKISTTGGNPPHVTNQVVHQPVHPQGQPKGQPKGQPAGKNQNQKNPG
jgi:hypothetical protein